MAILFEHIFTPHKTQGKVYSTDNGLRYAIHAFSIEDNYIEMDTGTGTAPRRVEPVLFHLHDVYIPTLTIDELRILVSAKSDNKDKR